MPMNRRFLLKRRPQGMPVADDFALVEEETGPLAEDAFLIRNAYASMDPAMRGWLDDKPSYMPPVPLGAVVRASTVGEVVESRNPAFPVGSWAAGLNGLELYSVGNAEVARPIDPKALPSVTHYLSLLGGAGLAAYLGLIEIGRPKPGETLLVSAAAGGVGSIVGQIAAIEGVRAIGIAGGPAKCARLRDYGYAAAIDYRGKSVEQLVAAIRAEAPNGIDLHFENVGGDILDAALLCLAPRARIVLCGMIAEYNSEPLGARNLFQLIVQGARMEGLIVPQHVARIPEASAKLAGWLLAGRLHVDEHIEHGIDRALETMLRLFSGQHDGKLLLRLDGEEAR